MTLSITKLNNGGANLDFVEAYVNSPALTAQDRLNRTRRTLAGVDQVLDVKVAEVEAKRAVAFDQITDIVASTQPQIDAVLDGLNAEAAITQTGQNRAAVAVDRAVVAADRVLAENARDASFALGPKYDSEPAGRAASADGATFLVVGTGRVSATEHRRINAGTVAPIIATYPSKAAVDEAQISTGELLPVATLSGQALNGAVFRQTSGRNTGLTAPANVQAQSAFLTVGRPFDAALLALLVSVGASIRISAVLNTSAGFSAAKPLSLAAVNVGRASGNVENQGQLVRNEQIGSKVYREVVYTPTVDDLSFSMVLQWPANTPVVASEHFFNAASFTWRIENVSTTGPVSAADSMLDLRLLPLSSAVASATAGVKGALLGSGNLFPYTSPSAQAFNGAVLTTIAGRNVGWTSPAGAVAQLSYVTAFNKPATAADLLALVGSQIRVWLEADVSANFIAEKPGSALVLQVRRPSGVVGAGVGTLVRREQIGNKLYQEVLYTVTADDTEWGACYQVTDSGAASGANAHSFQVTAAGFSVEVWAKGSEHVTKQDLAVQMQVNAQVGTLSAAVTAATTAVAAKQFNFVDAKLSDITTTAAQMFGGAVVRNVAGKLAGWTIPAGQSGHAGGNLGSLFEAQIDVAPEDSAQLAGCTVRLRFGFDTSPNYARTIGAGAKVYVTAGTSRLAVRTLVSSIQVSTSRRVIEITFPMVGDEIRFGCYPQAGVSVSPAIDAEGWVQLTDCTIDVVAVPQASEVYNAMSLTARLSKARAGREAIAAAVAAAAAQGSYAGIKTVKADGTGDFTHPRFAVESINAASPVNKWCVLIYPGRYEGQANWSGRDDVDMIAFNRITTIIHYENPDNVDPAVIPNTQTFWWNTRGKIKGLTVTGRNVRYPIHSDSSGVLKDRVQEIEDCWIEHLGNNGAKAYQQSIGTPAGSNGEYGIWASWHAWGCGNSSGMQILARRTTFISDRTAFYIHTREYFAKPSYTLLDNCACISRTRTGAAINIQPLGSLVGDILELRNTQLVGVIGMDPSPWIPTALADQPANQCEPHIVGTTTGGGAIFLNIDSGRALKIESADTTSASSVSVSGSAVPVIFGKEVFSKPGANGLKGYVYGWANISSVGVGLNKDTFITSLGKRLGDCTAANKLLTVSVNGGVAVTVTFNADYTNATNASILATINAALGASAIASEYAIGARYRPSIHNEEKSLTNFTAIGIPMGSVLAYDTDYKSIRLMTSADVPRLFAGVAWEDIYPGATGRVKTGGYLPIADVLRTDAAAFAFGDTFSVTAGQDGKVSKGGMQGLLPAIRADAVRVG